jgi:hypothetical protein
MGRLTAETRVILIGGGSSSGKTTLAAVLADRLGAFRVIHVDDLRPADAEFSLYRHEEWDDEPEVLAARLRSSTARLAGRLAEVTANCRAGSHLTVIEGEGVEPWWAAAFAGDAGVTAGFVIESDPVAVQRAISSRRAAPVFLALRPDRRSRLVRAVSGYAAWLRDEAVACDLPWVAAQPRDTLPDRFLDALSG